MPDFPLRDRDGDGGVETLARRGTFLTREGPAKPYEEGVMNSLSFVEPTPDAGNPIDLVEEIAESNEWPHDRTGDEELVIEISGRWGEYRLDFVWQEEMNAMHFSCGFEMGVAESRRAAVYELLAFANEKLWLGHFDLSNEEGSPVFRQTLLLGGAALVSSEQIEDLVDIAVSECERFYPAFHLVLRGDRTAGEALAAGVIDPVAEA